MDVATIRAAKQDEVAWVVSMIHRMVEEMASYGGHAASSAESAWEHLRDAITDQLKNEDSRYLIAESEQHERLGLVGAEVRTLTGAFAPRQVLEIMVVYVMPPMRRAGLASLLLTAVLDWARTKGCKECDLSVVARNPATSLYRKHGFTVSEFKMAKLL